MCSSCGMPLTIRSDLHFCFDQRFGVVFALTSQFKNRQRGLGDMAEPGEADAGQGTAHGVAVGAEGFGLKGPRGWAFRGVGFEAEAYCWSRSRGRPDRAGPVCCSRSPDG